MIDKEHLSGMLKGLALIFLFALVAFCIAQLNAVKKLSLSPLIIGIILGMVYANTFRNKLPEEWAYGIRFCTKQILRTGIVLYGFRLTITDIYQVGLPAVVTDIVIVVSTMCFGILLGKLLKLDPKLAVLTSTGSAVCGAAAVLGAESVVKPESYKTAIAVSTVVIFGTISMFLYPVMYHSGLLDNLSDTAVAVYTGATLHEVAHVAGAGNAMDPNDLSGIAGDATITKMIRVILLAPLLIVMSLFFTRKDKNAAPGSNKRKIIVPIFAFVFIAVIFLNTFLQMISGANTVKEIPLNSAIEYIDTFLLTMAMTALGTDTSIAKFRQAGSKPFLLAFILFVYLVIGGYFITTAVVGLCA